MAETTTAKFAWTKPDPGASANTWGQTLNATTDKIDAQVYANQQAGVPIGTVTMFAGGTAPTNWLLCQGQSLSRTDPLYIGLYNVILTAFGAVDGSHFSLPDLRQKFPLGAGSNANGTSGGTFAVALAIANLPAHSHSITDPQHSHTISQGSHTHTVNQWSHTHSDAGHSHDSAGSYQDAHSHTINQQVLYPQAGVNVAAGPNWVFPAANTATTDLRTPALHVAIGTGYASLDAKTSNISLVANGTGVTSTNNGATNITATNNTGSGSSFNVVPPFQAINFIIRYA